MEEKEKFDDSDRWWQPVQNRKGRAVAKTWKSFERTVGKLLYGKRVPLSGMNSGHKTSADVMFDFGHPAHGKVFIECKRSYYFNKILMHHYAEIRKGSICYTVFPETKRVFCIFSLNKLREICRVPIAVLLNEHGKVINYPASVGTLFLKCEVLAKKENKDVTICCFRVHGKHEIVCATDYLNFIKFKDIVKDIYEFYAAKLEKDRKSTPNGNFVNTKSKNESGKGWRNKCKQYKGLLRAGTRFVYDKENDTYIKVDAHESGRIPESIEVCSSEGVVLRGSKTDPTGLDGDIRD